MAPPVLLIFGWVVNDFASLLTVWSDKLAINSAVCLKNRHLFLLITGLVSIVLKRGKIRVY